MKPGCILWIFLGTSCIFGVSCDGHFKKITSNSDSSQTIQVTIKENTVESNVSKTEEIKSPEKTCWGSQGFYEGIFESIQSKDQNVMLTFRDTVGYTTTFYNSGDPEIDFRFFEYPELTLQTRISSQLCKFRIWFDSIDDDGKLLRLKKAELINDYHSTKKNAECSHFDVENGITKLSFIMDPKSITCFQLCTKIKLVKEEVLGKRINFIWTDNPYKDIVGCDKYLIYAHKMEY